MRQNIRFPNLKSQVLNLKFQIAVLTALSCILITIPKVSAQTAGAPKAQSSEPSTKSAAPSAPKPGSLEDKVEKYLRNMYAWGPQYEIKFGPTKPTAIPNLLEISVTVGLEGQSDTAIRVRDNRRQIYFPR
jgi:hypothetical protein